MAVAVEELVELKRKQMRDLEQLTYRRGIEPGPDMAFAGIRLLVAEGEAAAQFLRQLVPIQEPFMAWLEERQRDTETALRS
jgi:hypothetical protein